jgi:hypothetical protein
MLTDVLTRQDNLISTKKSHDEKFTHTAISFNRLLSGCPMQSFGISHIFVKQ